jgi:hypothetical protein
MAPPLPGARNPNQESHLQPFVDGVTAELSRQTPPTNTMR